jgi:hypothetical protein
MLSLSQTIARDQIKLFAQQIKGNSAATIHWGAVDGNTVNERKFIETAMGNPGASCALETPDWSCQSGVYK